MSNDRLIKPHKHGKCFVLSGPAGTGKTTLVTMLTDEFPRVKESVSCTTRPPRPDEVDDQHYRFTSKEDFDAMIQQDAFLEYVQLFDHAYGTPRGPLVKELEAGNHVILVIDTQGALQVRERFPATLIFVSPPSLDELRGRLTRRNTESESKIEMRLKRAKEELEAARHYDYQIVNEDLDTAYQVLRSIIVAEAHRTSNE